MLTNLLRRLRGALLPFEEAVLEAITSRMPLDLRQNFRLQVIAINKVQRFGQGREINFYRLRRGKVTFEESIRLPSTQIETVMAKATIRLLDTNDRIVVSVWLVRGFVFSLALNRSIPDGSNFEGNFVVDACDILQGALAPENSTWESQGQRPDGLTEWSLDGEIDGWRRPFDTIEREARIEALDSALPLDYLELLSLCDGFSSGRVQVRGLAELGPTPTSHGSIIVLAAVGESLGVGIVEGARDIEVHLVDYAAEGHSQPFGLKFRAALIEGLRLSGG